MSWLIVNGMQYHCAECGHSFRVEYEGSPCQIQVGEARIFQQIEMDHKYGLSTPSGPKDPYWGQAHYLHEECICANCYIKECLSGNQGKIDELAVALMNLLSQIESVQTEYAQLVDEQQRARLTRWVDEVDMQLLQSIAPGAYSQTVGHRLYSFPVNRSKLVSQYLTSSQKAIVEVVRSEIGESLYSCELMEDYSKTIKLLAEKVMDTVKCIYAADGVISSPDTSEELIVFCRAESIKKAQNLNQYICHESTMGIPVESTPDEYVYYLSSLEPAYIVRSINDALEAGWINRQLESRIDEKQLIKDLSLRIQQLSS